MSWLILLLLLQDADTLKADLRTSEPAALVEQTLRLQRVAEIAEGLRVAEPPAKSDTHYVVLFTTKYCGPCRQFKASKDYADIGAKFVVIEIDMGTADRRWVEVVPSVWLCKWTEKPNGTPIRKWNGQRVTLQQIEDALKPVPAAAVSVKTVRQYSHSELVQIHDAIHNQQSGLSTTWTWTGDLRTHLETVHGVVLE